MYAEFASAAYIASCERQLHALHSATASDTALGDGSDGDAAEPEPALAEHGLDGDEGDEGDDGVRVGAELELEPEPEPESEPEPAPEPGL